MQPLPNTYPLYVAEHVNAGDKVQITDTNGRTTEMRVEAVTDAGLAGAGQFIAYEDMSAIAVRRYDDRKTAKIVGGTLLLVALPFALEGLAGANHMGNVN
jgi:hypothetical protein